MKLKMALTVKQVGEIDFEGSRIPLNYLYLVTSKAGKVRRQPQLLHSCSLALLMA